MKLFLLSFVLLFSSFLYSQQITILEDQVKVDFNFTSEDVDGEFGDFKFTGNIDITSIETATFSGSVATESLDTNNWLRNRHLRSQKYFYTKAHPRLYFKSNTIEFTNLGFRVSGMITIKGITKDVVWEFIKTREMLMGVAAINTHDYDIKVYDERERNQVIIKIILPYTF
ncbi:MAG: polyisoprenoid-binding protein YceI [Dokdonia sp.]|jgi:polyisoprenoid-binding protein YceI